MSNDAPQQIGAQYNADAICCIMAKSKSVRLPGKNLKMFRGLPLFLWAVFYAREEGVQPVVFTDDEKTARIAAHFGALVYSQTPEQFDTYDAIVPAIRELNPKYLAHIQATNPFHKAGQLKDMLTMLRLSQCESVFTAESVKVLGFIGDTFYKNVTINGEESILHRYDGNCCACTVDYFEAHDNYFFGPRSKWVENTYPYTEDIDTQEDFDRCAELAEKRPELLVHPIRTIANVQNMRVLNRDYSEFIENCDLVVRTNRMDSLDTHLAGERTDIVLFSFFANSSKFVTELEKMKQAGLILASGRYAAFLDYIRGSGNELLPVFNASDISLLHTRFYPSSDWMILRAMRYVFPEACLYTLGTVEMIAHGSANRYANTIQTQFFNDSVLAELNKDGKHMFINEEDCTLPVGKFSRAAKDTTYVPEKMLIVFADSETIWPYFYYKKRGFLHGSWDNGKLKMTVYEYNPTYMICFMEDGVTQKTFVRYEGSEVWKEQVGLVANYEKKTKQQITVYALNTETKLTFTFDSLLGGIFSSLPGIPFIIDEWKESKVLVVRDTLSKLYTTRFVYVDGMYRQVKNPDDTYIDIETGQFRFRLCTETGEYDERVNLKWSDISQDGGYLIEYIAGTHMTMMSKARNVREAFFYMGGKWKHMGLRNDYTRFSIDRKKAFSPYFVIKNCNKYRSRRDAIRGTWVSNLPKDTKYKFFIGGDTEPEDYSLGDILWLKGKSDTYDGIPDKLFACFSELLRKDGEWNWLICLDDDIYIDVDKFLAYVKEKIETADVLAFRRFSWVVADIGGVLNGDGYILHRQIVEFLVRRSEYIPKSGPDDVQIGHILDTCKNIHCEDIGSQRVADIDNLLYEEDSKPESFLFITGGTHDSGTARRMLDLHRLRGGKVIKQLPGTERSLLVNILSCTDISGSAFKFVMETEDTGYFVHDVEHIYTIEKFTKFSELILRDTKNPQFVTRFGVAKNKYKQELNADTTYINLSDGSFRVRLKQGSWDDEISASYQDGMVKHAGDIGYLLIYKPNDTILVRWPAYRSVEQFYWNKNERLWEKGEYKSPFVNISAEGEGKYSTLILIRSPWTHMGTRHAIRETWVPYMQEDTTYKFIVGGSQHPEDFKKGDIIWRNDITDNPQAIVNEFIVLPDILKDAPYTHICVIADCVYLCIGNLQKYIYTHADKLLFTVLGDKMGTSALQNYIYVMHRKLVDQVSEYDDRIKLVNAENFTMLLNKFQEYIEPEKKQDIADNIDVPQLDSEKDMAERKDVIAYITNIIPGGAGAERMLYDLHKQLSSSV